MTDARSQQVKALVQAARDRPPADRSAFIAAAVGGDESLRLEVESLLNSDLPGDPSGQLTQSASVFVPGATVGPYRLLAALGAGGMGEVFRARDSKLNRDVALKVVPTAFASDPERLARFAREAQVLAALNHPHIAAIYGLEESAGRQALVLELVEGLTLAERIARGSLPVHEALAIADQIADALQAAHLQGIVHRDLKPANVKVTPAGRVKVLDFGLAKTGVRAGQPADPSQSPTITGATQIGVILGTAAYMSPEQARGQPVDARTDIWAFGCVLFEMLAARRAFGGNTASDSIAKILEGQPDWAALPRSVPPSVLRLLRRCLQKDPGDRPQHIDDARTAIRAAIARGWISRATVWAAAGAAAAAIAAGVYLWSRAERAGHAAPARSGWVQLTALEAATQPALSPDGRMLAFIRGAGTFVSPNQVYLKLLPTGDPVPLTHDDLPKMGPVFSPDGQRIAYTVTENESWDTWEVPTLRGEPRRWLVNASGLTWLSGGDLLFSEIATGIHMGIVRSSAARTASHGVYMPPHEIGMAHKSFASPDGAQVLVVEMGAQGVWLPCRLVSMIDGSSHTVGPVNARCMGAAWAPDGVWMYFTADAGDGFHVWRQRVTDGTPEQLTSGPTDEQGIAIAPDGRSLITSVGLAARTVWLHDGSGERQVSLEGYAYWPLLSSDGRSLLFRVTHGVGTGQTPSELWVTDLASNQADRLFPGQLVTSYDVSRAGRVAAAVVNRSGQTALWVTSLDGHDPPRPIPRADGDNPRYAPDGTILFRVLDAATAWMYRIREDGGSREKIGEISGTVFGTVSPDGEWLSGYSITGRYRMTLFSTSHRQPIPLFSFGQTSRLRWSPDGTRLLLSIQYGEASAFGLGRTYVVPLPRGSVLPRLPLAELRTEKDVAALPGVETLPYGDVGPGPSPGAYTFSRITTARNLYRIPIP